MIVRIIHVYVRKDSVEAFREATVANHSASIKESGVARFDVLQDEDDRTHFVLYEAYHSQEATEKHKLTPHYAAWKDAVAPLMARDRERSSFTAIAPIDTGQW